MHVLITGGAGLLGTQLAGALLARAELTNPQGKVEPIERITLFDQVPASGWNDARIESRVGDLTDAAAVARLVTGQTGSIFHLAAIVSSHAEADYELGMRVNFDATRTLLDCARSRGGAPLRMVFTSSVAAFGGMLPAQVSDDTEARPQSSYGAEKVMGEILLNDASRRGFVDARVLRMPTVVVRPGAPNKAASSFASSIIREPLNGQAAVCPVPADTRLWLTSPRSAVANLIHGHEIDAQALTGRRVVNLPGLSTTVSDMVAALGRVAGPEAVQRIRWEPDAAIMRIVNTWPGDFITERADALGFVRDSSFDDIVRAHLADSVK